MVWSSVDDEAQSLGGLAGVGFVVGFEFLAGQLRPVRPTKASCSASHLSRSALVRSPLPVLVRKSIHSIGQRAAAIGAVGREDAADFPEFVGDERLDLPLALDDQPDRDALHPAGRQALGDLPPQERADFIADDAVENSPRLLGVDPVHVDGVRLRNAF